MSSEGPIQTVRELAEHFARPKRILLVEDESIIRELLHHLCEGYNCQIVDAPDGEGAMRLLGDQKFDIVLLDINLGSISGIDLFRSMRLIGDETPVIFISGVLDDTLMKEINDIDFVCFMLKPCHYTPKFAANVMATLGVKKLSKNVV